MEAQLKDKQALVDSLQKTIQDKNDIIDMFKGNEEKRNSQGLLGKKDDIIDMF
jgi:hypothetical protein